MVESKCFWLYNERNSFKGVFTMGKIREFFNKNKEENARKKQAELEYVARNCGEPIAVKGKADGSDDSAWGVYSDGKKEYVVSVARVQEIRDSLNQEEVEA